MRAILPSWLSRNCVNGRGGRGLRRRVGCVLAAAGPVGTIAVSLVPLRAAGAKRLDLGGTRVVQELLVCGGLNGDQRDLAFGVVVDAPAVALGERRHAKMRVALAQELLPFCRPGRLRDVMEGGVHLKGNVLFVVRVRMLDE